MLDAAVLRHRPVGGPPATTAMLAGQSLRHSFSGQHVHVDVLGLLEKLHDIACGQCAIGQPRFEASERQRRQHEQHGDERHEPPRHKE
jgi:hypothetical protein